MPKTSELVADQIRAQIIRGELSEGGYLPPEGQLMEALGISRPTLREAFRILESEGLLSVVRGSRTGAKVHKPSVDLVSRYAGYVLESQQTTIADLYHARLAIEPSVVRWLATDPAPAKLDRLHQLIADLDSLLAQERFDEFVLKVESFHQALVEASGLKTLTFLSRMLTNLLINHQLDFQRRHPKAHEQRLKNLRAAVRSFRKVLELIEAGSVEEAVAHWRLHLHNANTTWTQAGEAERIVQSIEV